MTYPVSVRQGLPCTIIQTQIQNTVLSPLPNTGDLLSITRSLTKYAELIEELSTNVTLSYFSNAALTTNSSTSPTASVRYDTYSNHYPYEPKSLWITYGIGIGLALLCALIGVRAIVISGATFKNSWSTIFRTTRATELNNLLETPGDKDDASPTPWRIQQAIVVYSKKFGFQLGSRGKATTVVQGNIDEEQPSAEQEAITIYESAQHRSEHDSPQSTPATADAALGIERAGAAPANGEITPATEETHPTTERADAPATNMGASQPAIAPA